MSYTYSKAGNMTAKLSRDGLVVGIILGGRNTYTPSQYIGLEYDENDRLASYTAFEAPEINITYDNKGHMSTLAKSTVAVYNNFKFTSSSKSVITESTSVGGTSGLDTFDVEYVNGSTFLANKNSNTVRIHTVNNIQYYVVYNSIGLIEKILGTGSTSLMTMTMIDGKTFFHFNIESSVQCNDGDGCTSTDVSTACGFLDGHMSTIFVVVAVLCIAFIIAYSVFSRKR